MSAARQFVLRWTRTVHVYLTMLGLAVILFFAVTGFMLNHEDWFGLDAVRTRTVEGTIPADAISAAEPDRRAVIARLRADFGVTGDLDSFDADPDRLRVLFTGPGRRCEAVIDRADGRTEVQIESHGLVGLLTDLHKGKGAGAAWKLIIDLTAVLLLIVSITGLVMWSSLRNRRALGAAFLAGGAAACAAVYFLAVP
jgi:hypothetical protein